MSHFTVLVIGKNPEEQLVPFQENNMGDCPKEYLKYRVYAKDGTSHWFDSFEDFTKSGVVADDEGYWDNPNKKWDWYALGGRWTGFFRLKPGRDGAKGHPGLMTSPAKAGYADQAKRGDIDFEVMMDEAAQRAQAEYQNIARLLGGTIPKITRPWKSLQEDKSFGTDWDARRKAYGDQDAMRALGEARRAHRDSSENAQTLAFVDLEDFQCTEAEYVKRARDSAFDTFAVLMDGKWYERGQMGWWGAVSNPKEAADWNAEFASLIRGLSDDTLLSVYDCHI